MDAKHHVAVVALHNYCYGQSLHQVLPPQFKDLWFHLNDGN